MMPMRELSAGECLHCGNPLPELKSVCPFCGSHDLEVTRESLKVHKIDIGHNNWTVNQARVALESEFAASYQRSDHFLIVIHGRGSTGKVGEIKIMVQHFAKSMLGMRRIRDFISGEHLTRTSSPAKRVSTNYPSIKQLAEWNTRNPGLSILIL